LIVTSGVPREKGGGRGREVGREGPINALLQDALGEKSIETWLLYRVKC
jgi:hypothetical protein